MGFEKLLQGGTTKETDQPSQAVQSDGICKPQKHSDPTEMMILCLRTYEKWHDEKNKHYVVGKTV